MAIGSAGLSMPKILLVEDDHDLRSSLVSLLEHRRMTVDSAGSVSGGNDFLAVSSYDLVILDWNLPDGTGVELLQEIRQKRIDSAVLMLTTRAAVEDKVTGFESGADDYLVKPFHPDEFICRIQSLLRRPSQISPDQIEHLGLTLDVFKRSAHRGSKNIQLTPREFELLEFLMRHKDQVFSKEVLLERVWKADSESTAETVVATVLRLRKKVDTEGEKSIIRNVFGAGYVIDKE